MKRLFILSIIVAAAVAVHGCSMFGDRSEAVTRVWQRSAFTKDGAFMLIRDLPYDYETFSGQICSIKKKEYRMKEKFGELVIDEPWETTLYSYDNRGNLINLKDLSSDENCIYGAETYKYSDNNRMTGGECYDKDGALKSKWVYYYEMDIIKKVTLYDSNGDIYNERLVEYDDKGNIIQVRLGSYTETYKYDNNGRMIEVCGSRPHRIAYDNSGRINKMDFYDEEGERYLQLTIDYNSHGNVSRIYEAWRDGSRSTDEYEYEYDSYGNYIKVIRRSNSEYSDERSPRRSIFMTELDIQYY